jgi:hypothetical protein
VQHHRIFFWRYLAACVILVLAFGPIAGLALGVVAYWPVRWSAKRTAARINREFAQRAEQARTPADYKVTYHGMDPWPPPCVPPPSPLRLVKRDRGA